MSILYPYILWLLLPLALLFYYRPKQLTDTMHLVVLALLLFALSRPVIDQGPQEREIEANDIIIALDVSYSMRADDIMPDRYTYAVQTIDAFLQNNISDNITLIAFTTNPLLLSPPTTDHQLISLALKSFQPDNILTHGTSLENLLNRVVSLPIKEKNLILFTDGGEEKSDIILNSIIRNSSIVPIIVAMGTTAGSTIPLKDGTLLKDKEGNLVVSRINPLLETLASNNNGSYMQPSQNPETTARQLQETLDTLNTEKTLISKMSHSYIELYYYPLCLAALLFMILHTRAIKYVIIIYGLLGLQANASVFDMIRLDSAYHSYEAQEYNRSKRFLQSIKSPSLQSQMALANTHYKLGEYNKALILYKNIHTTSPVVKQQLYFNIANTYAMQKAYDKAKRYYTKALQLGDDEDAKHNLKVIAFLQEKKSELGIAHPKSQDNSSSKSQQQEATANENERKEDQPSSGSGSGGSKQKANNKEKMNKLIEDKQSNVQPHSSKVYELINRGYIHEKQPW